MPQFYIEGQIAAIQVNNIKGKDSTEDFTYYQNILVFKDPKTGDDKMMELNSKEDYRPYKNEDGVAIVTAYKTKASVEFKGDRKDATLYKLSLSDFTPANGIKDRSRATA